MWKQFRACHSDVALRRISEETVGIGGFSSAPSDHARHVVWTPSPTVFAGCDRKHATSQTQHGSRIRVSWQPPSVLLRGSRG